MLSVIKKKFLLNLENKVKYQVGRYIVFLNIFFFTNFNKNINLYLKFYTPNKTRQHFVTKEIAAKVILPHQL